MINGFGTASLLSFALFLMSCGGVTIPKDVADETANLPDKIDYNIHVKKYYPISALPAMDQMPKSKKPTCV